MATITVSRIVNAPVAEVWRSWDDFGTIDLFNPHLSRSFLLDEGAATGLGAKRQCDLKDGKNYIREEITAYVPERVMEIDIYDGTMPLRSAVARIEFEPLGPNRTEVQFTMRFTPKFGAIGRMMVPLMKRQFSKMLGDLLDGNAGYIEGELVDAAN
ncbi:SRPBCC family protein [Oceanomicrobium pacificus]|uniref:SRPBCC family protein n=1 Tax=Oceanomicrobium pacificus TaxID=2692916 RepID=A0A6B0U733_9RHOB|nr:SRPBCC family protein [Oceanomicrobium pacificus]MXU66671.1 SRPBCC family protein [Oceanomicrobium pacificus]